MIWNRNLHFKVDFFIFLLCRAKIGGLTTLELNALELEFLSGISFDLSVQTDDYMKRTEDLMRFAATRKCSRHRRDRNARLKSKCNYHDMVGQPELSSTVAFDAGIGLAEAAGGLRIAEAGRESEIAVKYCGAASFTCSTKSPTPGGPGPASPQPALDL